MLRRTPVCLVLAVLVALGIGVLAAPAQASDGMGIPHPLGAPAIPQGPPIPPGPHV